MLGTGTFVGLVFLPAYAVGQLMTAGAKCLPGYEWTFNSLNQSPCDVAASLAAVCSTTGRYDVLSLPSGYLYSGPYKAYATDCICSSVYYSMLSACSYCQSRDFRDWSDYSFNCTTVFVPSYPRTIPSGVKVPAWAYLNVLDGGFNVTRAQQTRGTESSRPPTALSSTSAATSSFLLTTTTIKPEKSRPNVGAIAGGVTGGVIGLALAVASITIYVRWKRSSKRSVQQPTFPPSQFSNPNMGLTPNSISASGIPVSAYFHTGDGLATNYNPQSQSLMTNLTGASAPRMQTTLLPNYAGSAEIS